MHRFRRVLGIALLLAISSMPASAVTSSRASVNSIAGAVSIMWDWLAPLRSLFAQDETDGRCGLDPWGCPTDPPTTPDGRAGLDPWG